MSLAPNFEKSRQPLVDLNRYIKELDQNLLIMDEYMLLCFDEYELLSEQIVQNRLEELANTFRHWIQHSKRTICLFCGSKKIHELEGIDWTNYLINVRHVPIGFLDKKSALKLITRPSPDFKLKFEDDKTAVYLSELLGGHPFLIQAAMYELVLILNNKMCTTAKHQDVETAIENMPGSS